MFCRGGQCSSVQSENIVNTAFCKKTPPRAKPLFLLWPRSKIQRIYRTESLVFAVMAAGTYIFIRGISINPKT